MSDKLVVEFYNEDNEPGPIAAIMSLHGGDNPASASLTISDFIAAVYASGASKGCDAYALASRFILWSGTRNQPDARCASLEAELIPINKSYHYQTARVFSGSERIRVELVPDRFTTRKELAEGNRRLKLVRAL